MAALNRKKRLLSLPKTIRLTNRVATLLNTVEAEYGPEYDGNGDVRRYSTKAPTLHASSTGLHVYVDESAAEFAT